MDDPIDRNVEVLDEDTSRARNYFFAPKGTSPLRL
jgi:hypothetical protein